LLLGVALPGFCVVVVVVSVGLVLKGLPDVVVDLVLGSDVIGFGVVDRSFPFKSKNYKIMKIILFFGVIYEYCHG